MEDALDQDQVGYKKKKSKFSVVKAVMSVGTRAMKGSLQNLPLPWEAKTLIQMLLDFMELSAKNKDKGSLLDGNRKLEYLAFVRDQGPKISQIIEKFMSRLKPGFTWVMLTCWTRATWGLAGDPDYYFSVDPLSYDLPRSIGKDLDALHKEEDTIYGGGGMNSYKGSIHQLFGNNWGSYELDNMARGVQRVELQSICNDIDGKPMKGCDACENSGGGELHGPMGATFKLWPRSDPEGSEEQKAVEEPTCEWRGIFDMHICKQFKGEPRPREDDEPKTFLDFAFANAVSGCKSGAWTHRVTKTILVKDNGPPGFCAKNYAIASAFMQMTWGYITTNLATAMYSGCFENMGDMK